MPDLFELENLAQQYDWILEYTNCDIPIYRINANDYLLNVFYHIIQILYQIQRHNYFPISNYEKKNTNTHHSPPCKKKDIITTD